MSESASTGAAVAAEPAGAADLTATAAAEAPRIPAAAPVAADEAPFSAAMEARLCEHLLGNRRHGL